MTIDNAAVAERHEAVGIRDRVDNDACGVVSRLVRAGYEAYVVGGCVRDLLLNRTPKDFDVATSAHPSEIRMLFKNCRLIGRRFRLAHIHFYGGKIIETATFRANPFEEMDDLPEDLLLSQDNVFGSAVQDARRRDFSVNGLFYDPENDMVIDYVGGVADLRQGIIRTIGEPDIRMREDPVRIIRAAKFAARLNFTIEKYTLKAMLDSSGDLMRCATARLVEEIYRFIHSGGAQQATRLLCDARAFSAMLPEIAAVFDSTPTVATQTFALLSAYDKAWERGYRGSNSLALAMLLLYPFLSRSEDAKPWLEDSLETIGTRLSYPKRERERVRLMLHLFPMLTQRPRTERMARQVVRRSAFGEALALYTLQLHAMGEPLYDVGTWKAISRQFHIDFEALPTAEKRTARKKGGRRVRRGGRYSTSQARRRAP